MWYYFIKMAQKQIKPVLFVLWISFLYCSKVVSGDGTLQLQVALFINAPQPTLYRETCCDAVTGICLHICRACVTVNVQVLMRDNSTRRIHRTIATNPIKPLSYRKQLLVQNEVILGSNVVSYHTNFLLFHHVNNSQCQGLVEKLTQHNSQLIEGHVIRGKFFQAYIDSSFKCKTNWYGKDCTTKCIASSNHNTGYYTCDPATGKKVCLLNYHGDNCTRYCKEQNDVRGHFRCTKDGEKKCLEGWTNSEDGCVKPVVPRKCENQTRWIELMTNDVKSAEEVWKSLKAIICRTVNKNCFGYNLCPANQLSDVGLLTTKEILIYNATLVKKDIKLRMKIQGNNRCIDFKENCLNYDLVPSDERIKMIVAFNDPVVQPHFKRRSNKKRRLMLYSLIGLFFLVLFMLLLDKLLKPKEVATTIVGMLTPNVIKRSRL